MTYSVKQAAEAVGKTKPTILRAIQKGAISATQDARGRWQIEPAELRRAYPHLSEPSSTRIDVAAVRTSARNSDATGVRSMTSELLLHEIRDELRQLNAKLTSIQLTAIPPSASALGTEELVFERATQTQETASAPQAKEPSFAEPVPAVRAAPGGDGVAEPDTVLDSEGNLKFAVSERAHTSDDRSALNLGKLLAQRGDIALAERRYAAAAELFNEAAMQLRDRYPAQLAYALDGLAEAFYRRGFEQSDTAALNFSIETRRSVLEYRPRERVPLEWAMTQNGLGLALTALGERGGSTGLLTAAVAAFRAALEECTRERQPSDWAATQQNLAFALWRLGLLESGTTHLAEAVVAFRAALEERPRDQALECAAIQHSLGNVLVRLGERTGRAAHLMEAVAAYQAALEGRTRDRVPLAWATSIGNQGIALMLLAERNSDATQARAAIQQIETAVLMMKNSTKTEVAADYDRQLYRARMLHRHLTTR